jgi:hypothetical protein
VPAPLLASDIYILLRSGNDSVLRAMLLAEACDTAIIGDQRTGKLDGRRDEEWSSWISVKSKRLKVANMGAIHCDDAPLSGRGSQAQILALQRARSCSAGEVAETRGGWFHPCRVRRSLKARSDGVEVNDK